MTPLTSSGWLVAGAALTAISARTSAVPVAMWLSLACLLHWSREVAVLPALAGIALALAIALAVGLQGVIPVSGPAFLFVTAGMAVAGTLPFAADRFISARVPEWASTLVFPCAWVALEFVQARVGLYGTNGSIAYTQAGDLPLMQVASLAGIWGISFIVAWFAPVANAAFAYGIRSTPAAIAYALVVGVALLAGAIRASFDLGGPTIRTASITFPAGLFAPGEVTRIYEGRVDAADAAVSARVARLQDRFLAETVREARAGARLVAWPEMNLIVWRHGERAFLDRARRVARDEAIYLAMGLASVDPGARPPTENKIVLVDSSGEVRFSYLKSRPLPGWEASTIRKGDGRLPVADTADGWMAAAICFENDFPDFVRAIGRAHADLWILPANDWAAVKQSHFEVAAFRAIENGTPILRAGSHGLSGAFDRYGRALAVTDHFTGAATMVAQIPLGGTRTVYTRFGDWFAWTCAIALAALLLTALRSS